MFSDMYKTTEQEMQGISITRLKAKETRIKISSYSASPFSP